MVFQVLDEVLVDVRNCFSAAAVITSVVAQVNNAVVRLFMSL
jgi:hypothetical protein